MDEASKKWMAGQVVLGILALIIGAVWSVNNFQSQQIYEVVGPIFLFFLGFGLGHVIKTVFGHGNTDTKRMVYAMVPVFLYWVNFYISNQLLGVWLSLGTTLVIYLSLLGLLQIVRIAGRKTGLNRHYISKKKDWRKKWREVEKEIDEEEKVGAS